MSEELNSIKSSLTDIKTLLEDIKELLEQVIVQDHQNNWFVTTFDTNDDRP